MADQAITDLTAATAVFADDLLEVVQDGVNKKVTADLVRGLIPFRKAISYDDADITTGVTIYTPAADELLMDIWFEIVTAWNGTTPLGDVGQFSAGDTQGLFSIASQPANLANADLETGSGGYRYSGSFPPNLAAISGNNGVRYVPGHIRTTDPIQYVVTQDGLPGGAATGATQGAGYIYILIATARIL